MKNMTLKWKQPLPNFAVIRFVFCMLLFLFLLCGSAAKASDKESSENKLPFSPGEQLVYQIRWEAVEAGVAFFNVRPLTTVGEQPCRHFSLKVESSPVVDVLYVIRNQLDSYTDLNLNHSVRYSKKETGSEQRDILVQFDWKESVARYSNFNAPREPLTIPSGTFDPLAAFYKLRGMDFGNKKEVQFPITDGKRCFMGKATVVGKETITCFNVTYDTYVIEPEVIHFGGVFEESDRPVLRFWISTDKRRLPVRIQSKVIFGLIIGELVSVR